LLTPLNGFVTSFGVHELSYATHVPEQIASGISKTIMIAIVSHS